MFSVSVLSRSSCLEGRTLQCESGWTDLCFVVSCVWIAEKLHLTKHKSPSSSVKAARTGGVFVFHSNKRRQHPSVVGLRLCPSLSSANSCSVLSLDPLLFSWLLNEKIFVGRRFVQDVSPPAILSRRRLALASLGFAFNLLLCECRQCDDTNSSLQLSQAHSGFTFTHIQFAEFFSAWGNNFPQIQSDFKKILLVLAH